MKARWIGVSGAVLVLSALILGTLGPRLFPTAFWRDASVSMNGAGILGNGMMGSAVAGDSNQPFDQRFLDQMIMHHQMAVMSAQMMIADSPRPELRDLARRIISTQQRESEQMRQWRRDWYGEPSAGTMQGMMMGGMMSGGMMTRDQMQQMMGATMDVDRMFLQMMIPHHQAAIAMAQQAQVQAEHLELKTLAQTIIMTQQAEIAEMQDYLRTWYGGQ